MPDALIKELKRRMEGALDALKREFGDCAPVARQQPIGAADG